MPTEGGVNVTILGENFGPVYNDCQDGCTTIMEKLLGDVASVYYSSSAAGLDISSKRYECVNAKVTVADTIGE